MRFGHDTPSSNGIMVDGLTSAEMIQDGILAATCVLCAGLFSGLTLAFFSLDELDLKITQASGTEKEKRCAAKVLPIIHRHHHLLVSLLLCNAVVAEALPIFLNGMFTEVAAIAISVTAVLFFGEIIPQSLMAANALVVGAFLSPLVWFLMIVTSPISYPIAMLLDKTVGAHTFELFGKRELREVIRMHSPQGAKSGRFSRMSVASDEKHGVIPNTQRGSARPFGMQESKIIFGAMRLSEYTVMDIMKTFLDEAYMLSDSQPLDKECINDIQMRGYSRVPVYRGQNREDIVGVLLVKTLLCLCFEPLPKDCRLTVGSMTLQKVSTIGASKLVRDAYDQFLGPRTGSQFAVVVDEDARQIGLLTLEDVLECVLQVDITDESDLAHVFPAQVAARNWLMRRTLRPGSMLDRETEESTPTKEGEGVPRSRESYGATSLLRTSKSLTGTEREPLVSALASTAQSLPK